MKFKFRNFETESTLKKHPGDVCNIQEHLASKLHQCALIWSDKCAHCEIGFDELKKKLASSTEPNREHLDELKNKIRECKTKLQGITKKLAFLLCMFV